MSSFLSDQWFDELGAELGSVTIGELDGAGLALGQVINAAPAGTVAYTMVIGRGRAGELIRGSAETADVTLVEDYETAQSIVLGASVADLLAQGRIKVRGDLNVLLGAGVELQALAQVLGAASNGEGSL